MTIKANIVVPGDVLAGHRTPVTSVITHDGKTMITDLNGEITVLPAHNIVEV